MRLPSIIVLIICVVVLGLASLMLYSQYTGQTLELYTGDIVQTESPTVTPSPKPSLIDTVDYSQLTIKEISQLNATCTGLLTYLSDEMMIQATASAEPFAPVPTPDQAIPYTPTPAPTPYPTSTQIPTPSI